MRLKSIKLAGFKSFVDPTTISLPSNLVAILGPNGCGKSNIIDAVKFVLGAQSKNLRGDTKEDVIFNGSDQRKPLGKASVELIFSNDSQKLGGEFAQYAEIAVRREVTRGDDAAYFLNGVRCRRRDIQDIFLGTGLGSSRSYAIIEQGTISRIVEAKPEDLRAHIEEAAMISKYKERRRETENRMQHTRENLERLTDRLDEMTQQLNHLQKQAEIAQTYQELKATERTLKAELLCLRKRALEQESIHLKSIEQKVEQEINLARTNLGSDETLAIQLQEELYTLRDQYKEQEHQFYQLSTELVRLEQEMKNQREKVQQWQQQQVQTEEQMVQLRAAKDSEQEKLAQFNQELAVLNPRQEEVNTLLQEQLSMVSAQEEHMTQRQNEWDDYNQRHTSATNQAEVAKTKVQHLEERLQEQKERHGQLHAEQKQLDWQALNAEIEVATAEALNHQQHIQTTEQEIQAVQKSIEQNKAEQQQKQKQAQQIQLELQTLQSQQTSLNALQKIALNQHQEQLNTWLNQSKLTSAPRLAQQIKVEPGYEKAVETVLGYYLDSICLDNFVDTLSDLTDFPGCSLSLLNTQNSHAIAQSQSNLTPLRNFIAAPSSIAQLTANVYVIEDLPSALNLLTQLNPHESFITLDGIWVSQTWLRTCNDQDPHTGVIKREAELKQINQQILEKESEQQEINTQINLLLQTIAEAEQTREQLQQQIVEQKNIYTQAQAKIGIKQAQVTQLQNRHAQIEQELVKIMQQTELDQAMLLETKNVWDQALAQLQFNTEEHQTLTTKRSQSLAALQQARNQANQAKEEAHKLSLQLQGINNQIEFTQKQIVSLEAQLSALAQALTQYQQQIDDAKQPALAHEAKLAELLAQKSTLEQLLAAEHAKIDGKEQEQQQINKRKHELQQTLDAHLAKLQQNQLQHQSVTTKLENLAEQFAEINCNFDDVLANLPANAKDGQWDKQLQAVKQQIEELGAVNLAAIEEYSALNERKTYLDRQHEDLTTALASLTEAIQRIDEETRSRFKATLDQVNEGFAQFFAKVFNGGRAELRLTTDDLLTAGVHITAMPPGKKNASIHLLSGGEKALTALSLVFAMFQLNPAPFCLLDEVDAPLDDANVGRYCQLVKEMSEQVQFIYISHNKLSMEMANQLIGVTMQEPGVSRIVAVDIDQAVSLAEAS